MRIYNNEITCQRGEAFQINFDVINPDVSPFVIPLDDVVDPTWNNDTSPPVTNSGGNPYFLLTITSSDNIVKNRYIKNWFVNLKPVEWESLRPDDMTDSNYENYPLINKPGSIDDFFEHGGFLRFIDTRIINLDELEVYDSLSETWSKPYDHWSEVPNVDAISGRIDGVTWSYNYLLCNNYYYTDCVFSCLDSNEKRVYKYAAYSISVDGSTLTWYWIDYECLLTFPIESSDSVQWISQNYSYNVSLIDGETTEEAYDRIVIEHTTSGYSYIDVNGRSLSYLQEHNPDLMPYLAEDSVLKNALINSIPLYSVDYSKPLLELGIITVNTNLKGGNFV